NPEIRDSARDPLTHYLEIGASEGRDPNPLFSTAWYLSRYPDVAASGINPLVHYLRHGAAEGRQPAPRFATASRQSHPELLADWADYAPIAERIAALEAERIERIKTEPVRMISLERRDLGEAAARLRLPSHAAVEVSIVVPVYNHLQ